MELSADTTELNMTASELESQTLSLKNTAGDYHRKMKCRKLKIIFAIVGAVLGLILIIVVPIVVTQLPQNNNVINNNNNNS